MLVKGARWCELNAFIQGEQRAWKDTATLPRAPRRVRRFQVWIHWWSGLQNHEIGSVGQQSDRRRKVRPGCVR